jgi:hypothetical protein
LAERSDREAAQSSGFYGLGIYQVLALRTKADEIVRIGKIRDLATSIGQDLVKGDGASFDPEDVCYGITFRKQQPFGFHSTQGRPGDALFKVGS